MQTVNFQCGHCNNLMAVSTEFLGQQVRCPHCQQVVVAPPPPQPISPFAAVQSPAPPPPPPPAPLPPMLPPGPTKPEFPDLLGSTSPSFKPLGTTDHEDIFAPNTTEEDDLFGGAAPRLEIPREPPTSPTQPFSPNPLFGPIGNGDATLPHAPVPASPANPAAGGPQGPDFGAPTLSYSPGPEESGEVTKVSVPNTGLASAPTLPGDAPWAPTGPGEEASGEMGAMAVKAPKVRRPKENTWFIPLVFIPLILYAIGATAAASIAIYKLNQFQEGKRRSDPLENLPDLEGDSPGVRKVSSGAVIRFKREAGQYRLPFTVTPNFVTQPMSEHRKVSLGDKVQIGDLEVEPRRVFRKQLIMNDEGFKPEPCEHESLVLELHLRNTSDDNAFVPLDNYFDRRWTRGETPPFTLLETSSDVFHGGPAQWFLKSERPKVRQWIEMPGRKNHPGELKPGEELTTHVATNAVGEDGRKTALSLFGGDERGKSIAPYKGALLWRVQLRRGLVPWRGKQIPATTVIGVRFTDKDYRQRG